MSQDFQARLKAYKEKLMQEMTFADQIDMGETRFMTEFANDIFANLRK